MMSELEVHIVQSFDPPGGMGEAWTTAIVPAVITGIAESACESCRSTP